MKINRGDFYTDCGHHPRLCTHSGLDNIEGISLVDGSIGNCSPRYCGDVGIGAMADIESIINQI